MKIGITFDMREDYKIAADSLLFADFCTKKEVAYMQKAIEENGYQVHLIGNMYALMEEIRSGTFNCDLVFVADEGIASRNREIMVPALLELNHIPYVGSDAYAMGLTQNKFHTKLVCEALGIHVPKGIYIPYEPQYQQIEVLSAFVNREMEHQALSFPLVVKPNAEGYSMGVFLVENLNQLTEKVLLDFDVYKQPVLCEAFIGGPELYVPIVGNGEQAYALEVGVCRHADGRDIDVFTVQNKCFDPVQDSIASLPEDVRTTLFDWSLKLHRHLECHDFSRADFKLDANGTPYLLEMNPRPGLTPNGPFETCAAGQGKSYAEIIGEIIQCARERQMMRA